MHAEQHSHELLTRDAFEVRMSKIARGRSELVGVVPRKTGVSVREKMFQASARQRPVLCERQASSRLTRPKGVML